MISNALESTQVESSFLTSGPRFRTFRKEHNNSLAIFLVLKIGTARPRGTLISVPKIFSVSQNSVSQGICLFNTVSNCN